METAKTVDGNIFLKKKIKFKSKTKDASIIFPEIVTDNYGHAMIIARMLSKVNTRSSLYYTLKEEDSRILSDSKLTSPTSIIRRGENLIHLHIFTKPNTKVKLHFVPGAKGTYTFLPIPEVEALRKKLNHGF